MSGCHLGSHGIDLLAVQMTSNITGRLCIVFGWRTAATPVDTKFAEPKFSQHRTRQMLLATHPSVGGKTAEKMGWRPRLAQK